MLPEQTEQMLVVELLVFYTLNFLIDLGKSFDGNWWIHLPLLCQIEKEIRFIEELEALNPFLLCLTPFLIISQNSCLGSVTWIISNLAFHEYGTPSISALNNCPFPLRI